MYCSGPTMTMPFYIQIIDNQIWDDQLSKYTALYSKYSHFGRYIKYLINQNILLYRFNMLKNIKLVYPKI